MDELLTDFDSFVGTEVPQEPEVTPVQEVAPVEQDSLLSDFDTFAEPEVQPEVPMEAQIPETTPEVAPIQELPIEQKVEAHRPPDVDDDTWMDIKDRVSKFLGEYTPMGLVTKAIAKPVVDFEKSELKKDISEGIRDYTPLGAVPKMVAGFTGEAMQKEGSQLKEASSVKARLENIEMSYSDLIDTVKASVGGDEELKSTVQAKQNKLNDEVVSILEDRGIEAFNDDGKLKVITKDKDGNEQLVDLDDNTLDNVLGGFTAGAGEIAGATMGAIGGATQAQRMLPPTAPLPVRGTAGLVGAGLGGYTGATLGRATDIIRNAISLNKEIDAKDLVYKSLEAGTADVVGGALAVGAGKVAGKVTAPIGKLATKVKRHIIDGNLDGAREIIKKDYGVTDEQIEASLETLSKDLKGLDDLSGAKLVRAELTSIIQQLPQGAVVMKRAIQQNEKASIQISKEINKRADIVKKSVESMAQKPSAIKRNLQAYEKAVGKNYGMVRGLIKEALPNYKSDLQLTDFADTLRDINTRVIDPQVKEKLTNLSTSLSSQKSSTVDDLINVRQLFNDFYGKNSSHFTSKPDKDALLSIRNTIDTKIDDALESLPEEVAKPLKGAFDNAKAKYAQMFKTQDTVAYKSIFKEGASEEEIAKNLVKYSKATDNTLEAVMSKLSPVKRVKAEFSILGEMVRKSTTKGEAKAIQFDKLLEDIGTSKQSFKTKEAQQFIKNLEGYDKKFGKDADLQAIAQGVAPKVEKNIATSISGKVEQKLSAIRFEILQKLIPTENAKRLALQEAIGKSLETARTPREFLFNVSKIKGMPNEDLKNLKIAVKEIAKQEKELQDTLMKEQAFQEAKMKKEAMKKAELDAKAKKLAEEGKKARWEKAKADRQAEIKAKKQQEEAVKEASEPKIGGSEDEAKEEVKKLFKKQYEPDGKYKDMSAEDIAELEKQEKALLDSEAETLFAKGGTELLGGAVAGIEQDENGNIALNPEKFVMGVLGVSTVKGLAKAYKKSPKTQAKVEKALKDLASDSARVGGVMLNKINRQIGLDINPKIVQDSGMSLTKPKGKEIFPPIEEFRNFGKETENILAKNKI